MFGFPECISRNQEIELGPGLTVLGDDVADKPQRIPFRRERADAAAVSGVPDLVGWISQ